ncbi:polyprenyl synthetase [candidate division LCP-89 bacterium B3_LCP]|uniref:Polyprenyl synthetase n=1 Tax=candidate division LCP-89 bacterium B3_LCP TaxID=2012998 RepID=A0A532UZA4_UNCL8|nr:MAG: polyprenyl synthetase [candidate division LCP-89 bacterium B3_LCP]
MNHKMDSRLEHFRGITAEDLAQVEKTMHCVLASDIRMVDKVVRYIVKHKGKSLRPILTLMCARLFGKPGEEAVKVAVIVELLHTATLVHDDVVDDSKIRRGFPSINAIWKNKVSVLVGDYLLAKALTEMLEIRDFEVLDILSRSARRMSRGELLQIAKARKLDITESIYFDMIGDKTAALFSACCELAAITSKRDGVERDNLRNFGEKIGLAFQIRDDVLDYEGRRSIIGKPTLEDIKDRKITLPLIQAIRVSQKTEGRRIIKMINRGIKSNDRKEVMDFIDTHQGLNYAKDVAMQLKEDALSYLSVFPATVERQTLMDFADFSVERMK